MSKRRHDDSMWSDFAAAMDTMTSAVPTPPIDLDAEEGDLLPGEHRFRAVIAELRAARETIASHSRYDCRDDRCDCGDNRDRHIAWHESELRVLRAVAEAAEAFDGVLSDLCDGPERDTLRARLKERRR